MRGLLYLYTLHPTYHTMRASSAAVLDFAARCRTACTTTVTRTLSPVASFKTDPARSSTISPGRGNASSRRRSEESKLRQYFGKDVIHGSENIERICTNFQKFVDARKSRSDKDLTDLKSGYLADIRSKVVAVDTF